MRNLSERLRPAPFPSARFQSAPFRSALRWETGLAVVVVLILIIGSAASPQFLTGNNLFNLGLSNGEIAIMTLPMALIIISGEIDLSVESILGMSSALLGVLYLHKLPMILIFVIVAVVGAAIGALLLQTINSALYVLGVSPNWDQAIAGFLLILAIVLDRFISVRLTASLRRRSARRGT